MQPLAARGHDELAELARALNGMVAGHAAQTSDESAQAEFATTMQVTRNEEEAHLLVKRHIERVVPGTAVAVLSRNNSADRLEATTPLTESSPLWERLQGAAPGACLAVRLSRSYARADGVVPLLPCELCSGLPKAACEPLLVGGEVIGSVLVEHGAPLTERDTERIRGTVVQAGPVLGNLRNLALAEFQANSDQLTGVPNRRAVQDTLKRMVAHASRHLAPLTAILLDLDHFKQVNDTYGHDKGDELLASVGAALQDAIRADDFVGRYGGEEFLILLPDTDQANALHVAETIHQSLRAVRIPGVERAITASLGVATIPDDAGDAATLVRYADAALLTAKRAGRNRTEVTGRFAG